MATKKKLKKRKIDPCWVSSQSWELTYIAKKFKISVDSVRAIKKAVGKNRKKIYAKIRETFTWEP